ncbi:MAG: porin [Marinobacterium sp.]|nr:porin [Marinobacterium sp.]
MRRQRNILPALVALGLCSGTAQAEFSMNGFGTLGVAEVHGEQRRYGLMGEYNDELRTEPVTRAGLQGRYQITDNLSATGQLLVKAPRNSYELEAEWAYLSYQASDELELRAGRLRLPAFLLSESLDVGYSYPWIRLPTEVYGQVPISRYIGGDMLYSFGLGDYDATLQLMLGQTDDEVYMGGAETDLESRDMWSASLTVQYDYGRVRIGHLASSIDVDTDFTTVAEMPPGSFVTGNARRDFGLVLEGLDGSFTSLGYTYENNNWIGYGEVAVRKVDGPDFPDTRSAFLTVGYRFDNLMPHLTWGWAEITDDARVNGVSIKDGEQTSWTMGLRYDPQPGLAFKVEYNVIETEGRNGFSGLFETAGMPRNADAEVLSLAVDFVF